MVLTDVPTLEASIDIAAPPEKVWALISDLRNIPRWSPQCAKSFVRGGGAVAEGTRLVNVNRRGLLVWPTRSKVVRFEPLREIAFRIKDNNAVWSYTLESDGASGTRLTERRDAPGGISAISVRLTDRFLGGLASFNAELERGMQQTLRRIKADAER
jgi:uncharacterized protein YndB with AHSA1/START domain